MRRVSSAELVRQVEATLDMARAEPVAIDDGTGERAIILSPDEYRRLSKLAFHQFCEEISKRAEARGLTDEKLAALLAEDD